MEIIKLSALKVNCFRCNKEDSYYLKEYKDSYNKLYYKTHQPTDWIGLGNYHYICPDCNKEFITNKYYKTYEVAKMLAQMATLRGHIRDTDNNISLDINIKGDNATTFLSI